MDVDYSEPKWKKPKKKNPAWKGGQRELKWKKGDKQPKWKGG